MSIEILKQDIKSRNIRNIYLFYGPEEYLKKYYLENIEKILLSDDLKTLNKIVLEGKIDINKIIDNCETMPVFSEKKIVVVKNSGFFKSKGKSEEGKGRGKTQNDDLISLLNNAPDHTCLIFYESEIDKRMKAVDTIKKNGLIVEFAFQKPAELVKWVVKVFKSYKKGIDTITASKIVDNCDDGMNEILNEINKIVLFVGEREMVSGEDINSVCSRSIKSRIFDLTDAISAKNNLTALKLLNDMLILKEPIPKILFMITRQIRLMLQIKLLMSEGSSINEAASAIGLTPYTAGKISKQAGNFTVETLKIALERSLEMDEAIKKGKIDDRIAAEILITEFSKKVNIDNIAVHN